MSLFEETLEAIAPLDEAAAQAAAGRGSIR